MAIESGLKTEEFFKLLKIFYMVDAGSYTIDAGGQKDWTICLCLTMVR
jgi:hypothetical protein